MVVVSQNINMLVPNPQLFFATDLLVMSRVVHIVIMLPDVYYDGLGFMAHQHFFAMSFARCLTLSATTVLCR